MLIYLVKNYEVSSVIPQIQPVVIMLSVLMGAFMFGESLSMFKIGGVCLIIGGMVVINMGKPVKVGKRPWKLGA
jgi:multidrug transporter EmrE-like cation transporter